MDSKKNSRPRNLLVFDVETTGLLPNKSKCDVPLSEYPHITQFSFVMYDLINNKITHKYDSYIHLDTNIPISKVVYELTGITHDKCNNGSSFIVALTAFYHAYKDCDCLIAHNMEFDEKMILIEMERHHDQITSVLPECLGIFNKLSESFNKIDRYCTMRNGTALCNIKVDSKIAGRQPTVKWPKLSELHSKLFNNEPLVGLHNSMVDVMVCLRCYLKMKYEYNIKI